MRALQLVTTLALALTSALACAQEAADVDTTELAGLTPEELFLRASSSALQFESMREPSRRLLVRNHEESIPYLVTQLDTDDARERHALEDIFVRIGEPAVQPVTEAMIIETARTDVTRGARLAAGILGRLGDKAAVGCLIDAHGHPDWKVRGSVAGALGRIASTEAAPALVALLSDGNEIVRKSAAVGLGRVAAGTIEDGDGEDGPRLDDRAIEALVSSLADDYYAVRYSASDALGKVGSPAAREIIDASAGQVGHALLMAVRSLGAIGAKDALPRLRELLDSDEWAVRAFAARAIGEVGLDRRSRGALERVVSEESHPFVLESARAALSESRE